MSELVGQWRDWMIHAKTIMCARDTVLQPSKVVNGRDIKRTPASRERGAGNLSCPSGQFTRAPRVCLFVHFPFWPTLMPLRVRD